MADVTQKLIHAAKMLVALCEAMLVDHSSLRAMKRAIDFAENSDSLHAEEKESNLNRLARTLADDEVAHEECVLKRVPRIDAFRNTRESLAAYRKAKEGK